MKPMEFDENNYVILIGSANEFGYQNGEINKTRKIWSGKKLDDWKLLRNFLFLKLWLMSVFFLSVFMDFKNLSNLQYPFSIWRQ